MELAKVQQQAVSLTRQRPTLQGLEEQQVLAVKYASMQVGKMTDKELSVSVRGLLITIHIITGWNFPDEPEFQEVLRKQFMKKLAEAYANLNCDEIEYAFRNYPVKDWGKKINLNLIDEVLQPYIETRLEISNLEERQGQATEIHYTEQEILNQRRQEIEVAYQAMKKGYLPIIHPYFKQVLVDDGLMNEGEELMEFFNRKLEYFKR